MARKVKVAVIGSGLSGLTAAYLLSTTKFIPNVDDEVELDVHLFEKASTLGMDSSSLSLPLPAGEDSQTRTWRIDVPMRSIQKGYYRNLIKLYKHLGVQLRRADYCFSFSNLEHLDGKSWSIHTSMLYNGQSGLAGVSMPSKLAKNCTSRPRSSFYNAVLSMATFFIITLYLLINYIRLIFYSMPRFRPPARETLRSWTERTVPQSRIAHWAGLDTSWRDFIRHVFVPLFSAVCTAPQDDIWAHPVAELLDYVWLTLFTPHYVAMNGVQDVVDRLSKPLQNIHLSSTIQSMRPNAETKSLLDIIYTSPHGELTATGFHHVIFAIPANHVVPILTSYLSNYPGTSGHTVAVEDQIACLEKFTYRPNIVVNHTDDRLLPHDIRDRRELNLITASRRSPLELGDEKTSVWPTCLPDSYTMATHILHRPSNCHPSFPSVLQTTNPIVPPRKEKTLSCAVLERVILTVDSKEALEGLEDPRGGLGRVQGARKGRDIAPGIWVCGSYAHHGIPLLEGCVVSARTVVEQGIFWMEGLRAKKNVKWY